MSIVRQCALLGVGRAGYYYEPSPETPANLAMMRRLDELHMEYPAFGSRRLREMLRREGPAVNRKRVQRLLQVMGLEAIYPKASGSDPGAGHRIYPYLLRHLEITAPDQVWCADITYVPMSHGFLYLMAVMDWWSRHVVAWELSNTMDADFCVRTWRKALKSGNRPPRILNTDQGAQFTSEEFVGAVEEAAVRVSMDGKGRWMDNRFIERLWRSVKYESIYLWGQADAREANTSLRKWFAGYNTMRPHQALCYATPWEWYRTPESYGARPAAWT